MISKALLFSILTHSIDELAPLVEGIHSCLNLAMGYSGSCTYDQDVEHYSTLV